MNRTTSNGNVSKKFCGFQIFVHFQHVPSDQDELTHLTHELHMTIFQTLAIVFNSNA